MGRHTGLRSGRLPPGGLGLGIGGGQGGGDLVKRGLSKLRHLVQHGVVHLGPTCRARLAALAASACDSTGAQALVSSIQLPSSCCVFCILDMILSSRRHPLLALLVGHATLGLGQEQGGQEGIDVTADLELDLGAGDLGDLERVQVGLLDVAAGVIDGLGQVP